MNDISVLPEPTPDPAPAPPPAEIPAGWEGILDRDERILWQGQPDGMVIWTDLVSVKTVFGLIFAGFAAFWMLIAFSIGGAGGNAPGIFVLFPLFGLPFLAVGLNLAFGRIFWDAYQRRNTFYTLTSKAAYIATKSFGKRQLKRHEILTDKVSLEEGDVGSVWFAERVERQSASRHRAGRHSQTRGAYTLRIPIGFRRITEARQVYRLIRDTFVAPPPKDGGTD